MYMNEYGDSNAPKILGLHPMGITGENLYQALIPHLKGNYCILAPDQGGHGKSGPYSSLEEEVEALKTELSERGYSDFCLLYGASMGVTVAYELLKDPSLHFEKIWFDGAGFSEHAPRMTGAIETPFRAVLKFLKNHPDVIGRSFTKHYGPSFGAIMKENFQHLGVEDVLRVFEVFSCREMVQFPRELQERMHLEWGENDRNYKNSQKAVESYFPYADVELRGGQGHCTYMARETADYVEELEAFITGREN